MTSLPGVLGATPTGEGTLTLGADSPDLPVTATFLQFTARARSGHGHGQGC